MQYRFDDIRVDLDARELKRAGRTVTLQRRAFEVLVYLIEHRDRAVSRQELLDHCWPETVVSDGSLTTCIKSVRKALGDPGRPGRIIATVHAYGYRFVAEVGVEATAPRGETAEAPASRDSRAVETEPTSRGTWLVGREAELEAVRDWLGAVQAGRGGLLRLEGEPGQGKTAVATRASEFARDAGALTLHATASEIEGAPALWLWILLVRDLASQLDEALLREVVGPHAASLTRLVPELGERLNRVEDSLSAPLERTWMLDALTQLFLRLARQRAVCIVLDDLQWADATSLKALEVLAQGLGQAQLGVLAAHRPPARRSPLKRMIPALKRVGQADVLALGPLDEASARVLVERTAGVEADCTATTEIMRRAQGHPLFLLELSRLVAQAPHRVHDLPESLIYIVEGRLDELPQESTHILYAAATSGLCVDVPGLVETCAVDEARIVATLHEAAAIHLLRPPHKGREGSFCFAHALIRDCIYELIPEDVRRTLHRQTYDYIERRFGRGPRVQTTLRYHARAMSDTGRLAKLTLESAREAYMVEARQTSSELARHTLTTHAEKLDSTDQARLLLEQARAMAASGAPLSEVSKLHACVRELDANPVAPEVFAECALEATGYGLFSGTVRRLGLAMPIEVELMEDALSQLPAHSTWRPLVESWLACLMLRSERCAEARGVSERALAHARDTGLPTIHCAALLGHASMLAGAGDQGERVALALRALELAEGLGKPALRIEALTQHMSARLSSGKECESEVQRIEAVAEEAGIESLALPAIHWRIGQALARLDFPTTRMLAQRALELTQRTNPTTATMISVLVELTLAQMTGTDGPWGPMLERAASLHPKHKPALATLLSNQLTSGQLDAAARGLESLMDGLHEWRSHLDWLTLLTTCGRTAVRLGRQDHVRTVQAALAPHEDAFIVVGDGLVWLGPVSYDLAMLADALDDANEAERLFAKAERTCDQLQALTPKLMVQTQWCASRVRREGRATAALERLYALREQAERLGYAGQVREVDVALASVRPQLVLAR